MGPVTYRFGDLQRIKEGSPPKAALEALRIQADEILTQPLLRVTDRRIKAPSGDPHDYMSVGMYWWPDPEKADGLPYINRDGMINPDTQDNNSLSNVGLRIHDLALAAFYFGDNGYSTYAQRQLYEWFLNPDTYMNPNARYAQAVPGICDGRGCGIIDFANAYNLFNGIGIFEELELLPQETIDGVRAWFVEFINWMLTHEIGLEEDNAYNNHGVWYDAQVLAAAVFTGRKELAKKICTTSYERRFRSQIRPDGSQPHELKRTKGMNYSLYNMTAFAIIAALAEEQGYAQYWTEDPELGVCLLKQTVDFLYPYVIAPDTFPYQELYPENAPDRMAQMLLRVAQRYPGLGYEEKAQSLMTDTMRWRLAPVR